MADDRCACGRTDCDAINRGFHRMLIESGLAAEFGMFTHQPRYRYFNGPRGEMFCWTTERMNDGKFAAFEYRPTGKGSRSGKATSWKLTREVRFRKRNAAKARALAWLKAAAGRVA